MLTVPRRVRLAPCQRDHGCRSLTLGPGSVPAILWLLQDLRLLCKILKSLNGFGAWEHARRLLLLGGVRCRSSLLPLVACWPCCPKTQRMRSRCPCNTLETVLRGNPSPRVFAVYKDFRDTKHSVVLLADQGANDTKMPLKLIKRVHRSMIRFAEALKYVARCHRSDSNCKACMQSKQP